MAMEKLSKRARPQPINDRDYTRLGGSDDGASAVSSILVTNAHVPVLERLAGTSPHRHSQRYPECAPRRAENRIVYLRRPATKSHYPSPITAKGLRMVQDGSWFK